MIKKILIANRGEIAVRIVRACAEMGIRSVAVYSDADRHALHVKRADEAHSIGAEPLAGYLNPRKLVNLAVETGCDALHPGYGFLSENAELADICAERGIKFIGPSAEVIRRMGDKTEARRSMIKAGVPVTPGTEGNVADIAEALTEGDRIGYPVMLKATSGGGGRGIRRCNSREELEQAFPRVISEATKAFGSAEVFLEKCIVNPKHIEAQILGDSFGNVVHLFERDCSIQRRNQKLIEIAPSPQLTPEQRAYGVVRPGGVISRVGVPQYEEAPIGFGSLFGKNVTLTGGPAPVRAYMEDALRDVLDGRLNPGKVFDRTIGIDDVPAGYRAMDSREALKVLVSF